MNDLIKTVLENPEARGPEAVNLAASQAAADFGPWGDGVIE